MTLFSPPRPHSLFRRFRPTALSVLLLIGSFTLASAQTDTDVPAQSPAGGTQTPAGDQLSPLSPEVQQQIQEIYAFKASLTPAERKLSTNLVLLSRMVRGKLPPSLARLVNLPARDNAGRFAIDVRGHLSSSLLSSDMMRGAERVNGQVAAAAFRTGLIRAHVSESDLLKLARHPDVLHIREAGRPQTHAGALTSQGYVSLGANKLVPAGIIGTGVRVGVLSDSAYPAQVAALIASGDLPADTVVLPGQAGPADNSGENEGTAMMEIVHDIAPGAKLFFASAYNGEDSFAANIRSLRNDYGCDIIVDDVSYSGEAVFQDGPIAQAVNDVTASGALYVSSAGNAGNASFGTSSTWEGDFRAGGSTALINTFEGTAVALNNFSTTTTPLLYDATVGASSLVELQWSDAFGSSSNDYDLFLVNAAGTTLLAASIDLQDGEGDPIEGVQPKAGIPSGSRLVVALYNGSPRAMHLNIFDQGTRLTVATSGATAGHNGGANTFTAAAVYWNAAHRGVIPFTGGSANPNEVFSSDGPRKIFYNADGSAITPGNFLFAAGGGKTLIKPDAAAPDGVVTKTTGFNPFFGTSAAAPHAAGVAALIKGANPTLTNTQIRNLLTGTALDNMSAGIDRDSGYGILTAPASVSAAMSIASSLQQ